MPGGLLNLVSTGKENVILNNNPQKSFFKAVYLKYTNFGMQKFRIDFTGQKTLKINDPSYFSFKIPRHGDLLMDTYLVVNLPNIWSPLYKNQNDVTIPYEFQWIRNIGTEMIEEIEISSGGQTLQKYSGTYINFIAHRDYSHSKREVFNDMTGNSPELYDPANINNNNGFYPNTKYNAEYTREPSIRGRTLYIPITTWFSYNSQQAVPLVALQYSEININIKFRPVKEIFTILNITGDTEDNDTRIQSNQNETYHQFHRFLVSPPMDQDSYTDTRSDWNNDIHLIANYAFLSEEERNVFTQKPQKYLIKEVYQSIFYDIASSAILNMASSSLVASWMFALRRSDVKKYNEWTNYTNWKHINKPPILEAINNSIKQTGHFNDENIKEILLTAGILVDGKYRENVLDRGLFKFCSVFSQSQGSFSSLPFVYNYNFCLNTSPFTLQPSGSMNLSSHKNVELEITTHTPPFDEVGTYEISCDPDSGAILGIKKPPNSVYEYTYDLILFEERWNIINFTNGLCGLQFAR